MRTESDSNLLRIRPHRQRSLSTAEGRMDRTENLVPLTPSNTPQTPTSRTESPDADQLQATMMSMQNLNINRENFESPSTTETTVDNEFSHSSDRGRFFARFRSSTD